jgi:hypothetical protein
MKLMVSAKPFTERKSVLPAIATRSGLPILSGVRLEASESGVAIEATDLELTARRLVRGDVTVDGSGSIVVPAKALVKAVAAMGEPEIVLESCDGRAGLDVRAGTRTVSLQGWPSEDWPGRLVPRLIARAGITGSATASGQRQGSNCHEQDGRRISGQGEGPLCSRAAREPATGRTPGTGDA